jgi:hypothetical protein
MSTIIKVPVLDPATGQFVDRLITLEEWMAAAAAAAGAGGGGGGGGGVKSFNTRKGHVVPVLGDYTTGLITQDSVATLYTGDTNTTESFDEIAARLSFSSRSVAVTTITTPLTLAALTTAVTVISVASDDDANVVRVPAGLTLAADGFRLLRIFNDPAAGSTNAFLLSGAVAQSFNGTAGTLTVLLGDAVTLQLHADDSWHVVDYAAARTSYSRRALAVTVGTSPLTLAALTTASTNISLTSDDDANEVLLPAGLTFAADGFRLVRIFNNPGAGSVANFSLDAVVPQTFNGITAPLVVSPGQAVSLQLNGDDSWQVVSSGPSQFRDGTTIAAPGSVAIPTLTADNTIYNAECNAAGGGVTLPTITWPDDAKRTLRVMSTGTQTLNVSAEVGNTIQAGTVGSVDLAAGEGTVFQPFSATSWHVVIGGTIAP